MLSRKPTNYKVTVETNKGNIRKYNTSGFCIEEVKYKTELFYERTPSEKGVKKFIYIEKI